MFFPQYHCYLIYLIILAGIIYFLLYHAEYPIFKNKENKENKENFKTICFEILLFILIIVYLFLFAPNDYKENNSIYFGHIILIILNIYYISRLGTEIKNKEKFIAFISFSFIMSIILPLILMVIRDIPPAIEQLKSGHSILDRKIKSTNIDRIMQIIGQQDKYDKIYYIEENFIKTNLEPTSFIVEVENHKNKKPTYEYIEYNKYVAYCGKIYLDTGDKTVFKKFNSDKFLQIPSNKIFEYQGRTLTCEIIVVWENPRDFVRKLLQFKNH